MTASYIPLLAIQQRPHSRIYAIPAKELGNTSEILSASREVRQRLRGVVLALPKSKPAVEPEMHVVPWPETPKLELVHEASIESAPLDMHAPCSWKFLVKVAALQHGQTSKDVLGRGRTPPVIKARHLAMYLVATHTVTNATRIGNKFGRDHASVLSALSKFPPVETRRLITFDHVEPVTSHRTPPEKAAIIVQGYAEGLPRKLIAEQIGMSLASVKGFAYRHGLKHGKRLYYVREAVKS